ncbi:TATA box-binding protein-associated factor RNA polymerase I subunit B [Pyxicephalus adspersus]|uniref:TATA box-binding protein-associated factor RNA polymerase I subunit B n=1 Tax=Pyxicephalus adspersus TaxID=30357 RepID=UPI003B5CEC61
MDEESTRDYKEPCPQCADVNWGISDACEFYCRSCHKVIEKTRELEESEVFTTNAKIHSLSRGLRGRSKIEKGWEWYICEGFQCILLKQAEALEALGVDPRIKDEVMCNFWRRYLQKTQQAYCNRLTTTNVSQSRMDLSDLDSEPEIFSDPLSDSDKEPDHPRLTASVSASSVCSGSVDGAAYMETTNKCWGKKMSMPMTLAFCYLSLLWLRESITLSDLLRLLLGRHIPYFNPEQYFPEQMKIYGFDSQIFRVKSLPTYKEIFELSHELGILLDLPVFPPITETCFYHPNVLCMKYLMEVNLPDELHNWTYRVSKKTRLDDVTNLTFDSANKKNKFIRYEIQAVAIIIVVLKILFVLSDDWEWHVINIAQKGNKKEKKTEVWHTGNYSHILSFHLELIDNCEAVTISPRSNKWHLLFYVCTGMTKNLLKQFSRLAGTTPDAGNEGPSTFLFNWEEQNTSKISFHGHSLEGITKCGGKLRSGRRTYYWFSCLKKCSSNDCAHWRLYDKSKFPSSYDFILSLFSLVLGVDKSLIHYEVGLVENNLFKQVKRPKKKAIKSMS